MTPWQATDTTGISWPVREPDSSDCAPAGGPMVGSCADWDYSTIYYSTILLRKPDLLKWKYFMLPIPILF